jgi:hypothetical protein
MCECGRFIFLHHLSPISALGTLVGVPAASSLRFVVVAVRENERRKQEAKQSTGR